MTRKSVLTAVSKLHGAGYIHGDLRGPNLKVAMTDKEGGTETGVHVKIIDFDWAGP
jgi:tRNA A-37 threonylcarbamoyl transferase component Bud32